LDSRERGTARFIEEFQSEAREDEEIDEVLQLNNFQKEQQNEKNIIERVKPGAGVREYKTKSDWAPAAEPARAPSSSSYQPITQAPVQPTKVWRVEPARAPSSQPTKVRQEPFPDVSFLRKEREPGRIMSAAPSSNSNKENEEINPNSLIRMDL